MALAIGLMSGTSMDGVDAALIETNGTNHISALAATTLSYPLEFQHALKISALAVAGEAGDVPQARAKLAAYQQTYIEEHLECMLKKVCSWEAIQQESAAWHLRAVQALLTKSGHTPAEISVVGYHGQTVFHQAALGMTVQLGAAAWLAEQLQIPVVHRFRENDLSQGGQGAPLVPLYHQALAIRDGLAPSVIVNGGGIANVTIVRTADLAGVWGYDCGPGNVLLDRYVALRTGGRETMDKDGQYALRGKIHPDLLETLKQQTCLYEGRSYFLKQPPKSLDSTDLQLIPALFNLSIEDACATLVAFTAETIVDSLNLLPFSWTSFSWVLVGGAWANPALYRALVQNIQIQGESIAGIHRAEAIGWSSAAIEAEAFAYLALRSLQGLPLSVPQTTGVRSPVSGGEHCFP